MINPFLTLGSPPLPHHMIKCIVYNMPPRQAIEYTGANVSKQGIYQRIARWRKSLAPPNLAQLQAIEEEWNARKKREAAKRRKEDSGVANDVDDEDDDDDDNDDEGGRRGKKKHSRSACNVSLGNRDLSNIVNGFPGDDVSKRPFDYTFTKANIINSWIAVGFLPMTANAVNDPKVRYELGEGGAPEAEQKRIAELVEDYQQSRGELAELGFNAVILDPQPKVAENHPIPADEEAAIEALMKKGGANKAGSLFRVGISVANCRVVLETLRRTKEQAEKVKEQKEKSRQVAEDGC
jgi:hypothetical protein